MYTWVASALARSLRARSSPNMGRWAQARRRGSSAPAGGGLGPPPAPLLTEGEDFLLQEAQGLADTGGRIRLFQANAESGPYTQIAEGAWEVAFDWVGEAPIPGKWYVTTEVGNGTVYAGQSANSNAIQWG